MRNKFSLYFHRELAFIYFFLTFCFFRVFVRTALTFKAPRRSPFLSRFIIVEVIYKMNPLPFSLGGEGIGEGDFTLGGGVSLTELNGVGVTALGPCKMAP